MNFKKNLVYLLFLVFSFNPSQFIHTKEFKGAEYRTKLSYTYGRFEVNMKSAGREGLLSSFFTYFDGTASDPWSSSKWNEIDLEIMGRYDDNVQFNTITPGQTNHVGHFPTSFSPHLDYHTYAFEWTPDYVAWFVDDIEVLRQTGTHIQTLDRPQKIMMNIWNPVYENWAGIFNSATLPAFAYYDWVSYYNYTPGSGNYGTDNNFTLNFKDDFDSWNIQRWEKGTHTWDGNGCDFISENVVFQDGKMILCLTNSINIGYTDLTSPTVLWARSNSVNKVTVMFSEEIDKGDAENISKYNITTSGVSITNASLNTDLKSVDLTVTGFDLSTSNLILVYPVKDRAAVPNSSTLQAKSIILSQPLAFPIKINCGGSSTLDYLPEASWNQDTEYGSMDGANAFYSSLPIGGTEEDAIYQSDRYSTVGYKIRVPNGNYDVKLMFAENYFTTSSARVFDVYIEHNRVLEKLDIYNQVGKSSAFEKEFLNISVNDEVMDIHFAESIDNSLINGIIITQNTTGINDGGVGEVESFRIEQNYPNPFNGMTVINYYLPSPTSINFVLYDVLGKQIFFKNLGFISEGYHQYKFNSEDIYGNSLASGVYFYSLIGIRGNEMKKMVLLK